MALQAVQVQPLESSPRKAKEVAHAIEVPLCTKGNESLGTSMTQNDGINVGDTGCIARM